MAKPIISGFLSYFIIWFKKEERAVFYQYFEQNQENDLQNEETKQRCIIAICMLYFLSGNVGTLTPGMSSVPGYLQYTKFQSINKSMNQTGLLHVDLLLYCNNIKLNKQKLHRKSI